jgi:hypothetical protein
VGGVFAANVYVRGVPTLVVVDDYLPTQNGALVFDVTSADGSLWGPLMEKVWAKVNGNYEMIIAGDATETFDFLLGAPTIEYDFSNAPVSLTTSVTTSSSFIASCNTMWNIVYSAAQQNLTMGAGVGISNTLGLPDDHAYTLLNAFIVTDAAGVVHRLVQLRNPWGYDVYTGRWNDSSSLWTAAIRQQVGYNASSSTLNDGIFFVEDFDFMNAYYGIMISYYQPSYFNNYYEILNDNKTLISLSFTLTSSASAFVGAEFYDTRMYPYGCKNAYSYGSISLYNINGTTLFTGYQVGDWEQFNYEQATLPAGTYIFQLQMSSWAANDTKDFTAKVYANA